MDRARTGKATLGGASLFSRGGVTTRGRLDLRAMVRRSQGRLMLAIILGYGSDPPRQDATILPSSAAARACFERDLSLESAPRPPAEGRQRLRNIGDGNVPRGVSLQGVGIPARRSIDDHGPFQPGQERSEFFPADDPIDIKSVRAETADRLKRLDRSRSIRASRLNPRLGTATRTGKPGDARAAAGTPTAARRVRSGG